jgi:hypothetical protein
MGFDIQLTIDNRINIVNHTFNMSQGKKNTPMTYNPQVRLNDSRSNRVLVESPAVL